MIYYMVRSINISIMWVSKILRGVSSPQYAIAMPESKIFESKVRKKDENTCSR